MNLIDLSWDLPAISTVHAMPDRDGPVPRGRVVCCHTGETTHPAAKNLRQQQTRLDRLIGYYNGRRSHQALNTMHSTELYQRFRSILWQVV